MWGLQCTHERVQYVQFCQTVTGDRLQAAWLVLNRLDELILIGCTYDQWYGQIVHDGEHRGLTEVSDLDV